MDQVITPAIWCDGTADEAAQFYADVFRDTSIAEQAPGLAATVSIHDFTFTPGVSIIVSCRDQEEIDATGRGSLPCPRPSAAAGASTGGASRGRSSPTTSPSSWPTPPHAIRSCTWARSTWPSYRVLTSSDPNYEDSSVNSKGNSHHETPWRNRWYKFRK